MQPLNAQSQQNETWQACQNKRKIDAANEGVLMASLENLKFFEEANLVRPYIRSVFVKPWAPTIPKSPSGTGLFMVR
jgi:hypothetical protein